MDVRWPLLGAVISLVGPAAAERLSPIREFKALTDAVALVRREAREVVLNEKQSFDLSNEAGPIAAIVSGRALKLKDGTSNSSCFHFYKASTGASGVLWTVGTGEWEAETCLGVDAIGLLPVSRALPQTIGVVYRAASPNAAVSEPLVLRWNAERQELEVDLKLSKRASLAGATTLKGIAASLDVP